MIGCRGICSVHSPFIKIKKAFLSQINSGKESFFTVQGVLLNDVSRLGLFDTVFIREGTIPVVLAYNCKL